MFVGKGECKFACFFVCIAKYKGMWFDEDVNNAPKYANELIIHRIAMR